MKIVDQTKVTEEATTEQAPIQTQCAQELEAIAKLGPNPTIEQILALHRLDG